MNLAGKLSIGVASLWACGMAAQLNAVTPDNDWISGIGEIILLTLAFPLALLGTGITSSSGPSSGEWIAYLILMVPNTLLWGHVLAGLCRLVIGSKLQDETRIAEQDVEPDAGHAPE